MLETLKKLPWRKRRSIPAGLRIYVVGDVHGSADALARRVLHGSTPTSRSGQSDVPSRSFSAITSTAARRRVRFLIC